MFEIKQIDSLSWPVKVNVPADDGSNGTVEGEFKARFKYLPTPEFQALLTNLADANGEPLVKAYILGWDDLADSVGKPLPFNEKNLNKVLQIPYMLAGLNKAFIDCQMGRATKN